MKARITTQQLRDLKVDEVFVVHSERMARYCRVLAAVEKMGFPTIVALADEAAIEKFSRRRPVKLVLDHAYERLVSYHTLAELDRLQQRWSARL